MRTRIPALLLFISAVVLCSAVSSAGQTNPKFYGKTIGEWSADWWNWAVSYPFDESPLLLEGEVDVAFGIRQVTVPDLVKNNFRHLDSELSRSQVTVTRPPSGEK